MSNNNNSNNQDVRCRLEFFWPLQYYVVVVGKNAVSPPGLAVHEMHSTHDYKFKLLSFYDYEVINNNVCLII